MLRRYELTDQEWKQIEHLFPPENTGKRGRPRKDNRTMLNAVVWIARSGAPWRASLNAMARGRVHTAVSENGLMTASLTIFSVYSAWMRNCRKYLLMPPLYGPISTAPAPEKTVPPPLAEIGHSQGSASTKIHAAADSYGYPVCIIISEGQRNDINFAIPVLEHINIKNSCVPADRGYDSNKLIDYIYDRGGEPTIPSRKGAKFQRLCDWWLYKERHLVEKFFLKLKTFRRIATRYDKLSFTYLGFICIASILIWLK